MKHLSILITICCLGVFTAKAQISIQWQKAYGGSLMESIGDIKQTSDGGYILIGSTSSIDGDVTGLHGTFPDAWVVKLNSTGSIIWQKCLGGTKSDRGYSIMETSDGGYIACNTSNSTDGNVTGLHGTNIDIWVVKLTSTGSISWQKCFGGTGNEDGKTSIMQTTDGGYIFTGTTESPVGGDITKRIYHPGSDIWVVKITDAGVLDWQQCYGSTASDWSGDIKLTNDGGYIFCANTGHGDSSVGAHYGTPGLSDFWIAKTTTTGSISWKKTVGGTEDDRLQMIYPTLDNGFLTVGKTKSSNHDVTGYHDSTDALLVKQKADGSIEWAKAIGGTKVDEGFMVTESADNNIFLVGKTMSPDGDLQGHNGINRVWICALDKSGTIKWHNTFGPVGSVASCIIKTSDGGLMIGGTTTSDSSDAAGSGYHGAGDIWLLKLSYAAGIEKTSSRNANIHIYPTVTNDIVKIKLPIGYENAHVQLADMQGKLLEQLAGRGLERIVSLKKFTSGTYLLLIKNNGEMTSHKVVYQPKNNIYVQLLNYKDCELRTAQQKNIFA